jgi:hypothetical protein
MINPTTHAIDEFPLPKAGSSPGGITAGPDGNLWFTERGGSRLGRINPITHASAEFPLPGATMPWDITRGPDGNLWFSEYMGNRIGIINPYTYGIAEISLPKAGSGPLGITPGPDSNLWFTESDGNRIGRINPTTHAIAELPLPTAGGYPYDITSGPDGNLWFTEYIGNRIGQFELKAPEATAVQLTAAPMTALVGETVTLSALVTSAAGTPGGTVNFLDGTTVLNPTPIGLDSTGHATFQTAALAQGTHAITAVYAGSSGLQAGTSAAVTVTINAPAPPRPTGVVASHSRKGMTGVSIAFDRDLDPSSARTAGLYLVLGAVKKGRKIVYSRNLPLKPPSYGAGTRKVTLVLARPYKGVVKVTVRSGLKAANGATSPWEFSWIMK